MTVDGLLLAAGSGSRLGTPKALVRDDDGTSWLLRAVLLWVDAGDGGGLSTGARRR